MISGIEGKYVLGILTGISPVSGVDYYRGIGDNYGKLKGTSHLMPPNPTIVMSSVDCDVYAKRLTERDWEAVYKHLVAGAARLVSAGCNLLVIASNTG